MGTQPPSKKGGGAPNFRPMSIAAKRLDASGCHLVRRYRPQPIRHCVRWRPSSPSQKGGGAPSPFSAHVYCGQTAGWIKMALGVEVRLGLGHIVLDGDTQLPYPKQGGRAPPPVFGPSVLWSNGWMEQDATLYGGRPRPVRHCVRWGSSPLKNV